jgi:D-glycero-D-manno-heptose 1,7-bisphosphate phosphatase
MRRAVFMDRDGVINRACVRDGVPHPPASAETLEVLPHVPEALKSLKAHGFLLIVVTNQPDVARGISSRAGIEWIHSRLKSELTLDAIFTCFHDRSDGCDCRKPRPGLLLQGAESLGIDLSSSFMVGDRGSDMEAGRRAGCRTLFVEHCDYREAPPACFDYRVDSLLHASKIILAPAAPARSKTSSANS